MGAADASTPNVSSILETSSDASTRVRDLMSSRMSSTYEGAARLWGCGARGEPRPAGPLRRGTAAALRGRRTSGKKARTLAGIATDVGRLTEGAMKAEAVAARARRRNMVAV